MKTYKKVKFKSREEWLKNGRKFGGSSAAAILGVSHWKKKIDIWYKFKTGKVDESKATENQTYGTFAEAPIREIVKLNLAREGVKVKSPKGIEMYVDKTYPFLTATLDGVLEVENEELNKRGMKGNWLLEIKTHELKGKEDEALWDGRLPQEYLTQVLHYLMVMNDFNGAVLVAKLNHYAYEHDNRLFQGEEFRYYYIYREEFEQTINKIKLAEIAFYERFIKGNEIPAF